MASKMDRPLDKRRKVSWRIAGKLMDPPDADGDVFWIVELHVSGNFGSYRHPIVQFMVARKLDGYTTPVPGPKAPTPPFYLYTIEVTFKGGSKPSKREDLLVRRVFDREGRYCVRVPESQTIFSGAYALAPEEEEVRLGNPISDGLWRAIITGGVRDSLASNEVLWKSIAPYLLQMSSMPEMQKMEEFYLGTLVTHGTLHTAAGEYEESKMINEEEGLSALIKREEKLIEVARPFLWMPAPTTISKEKKPLAHGDLHTDAGAYEE